ncbi:hypothetical protein [Algoriphagus terrigena]|uniref:hypothetical protein n=1 Tax=Algoriphagus terrigena TaxID=344884 RepID=UPI0004214529|nr:hypothetical protein [Algoriphagus terrigena]
MKQFFQSLSKPGSLCLLAGLFLLFNFLLSSTMPKEHALDLMFAYSADDAYGALAKMDLSQRETYRIGIWALDMPYMAVYFLLFSGLLIRLLKNTKVAWLPFGVLVMDLFENLSVLKILALYPVQNMSMASVASLFTTSKWVLVVVLLVVLVFGLLSNSFSRKYLASKSAEVRI